MRLVLFGFEVPGRYLETLRNELASSFDFRTTDSHQFDLNLVRSAEVLVLRNANQKLISEASACKWIHSFNAGIDEYLKLDIFRGSTPPLLTNSSGIYGPQISEHVFAMILALTRGIRTIVLNQEKKDWVWPKLGDGGSPREIGGLTMGVIGLGDVGHEVAKRAKSFGLGVLGVKRDPSPEKSLHLRESFDEIFASGSLDEVLSQSDIVVNALPLTNETRGLFNTARFSQFKRGAIFVNVGRGATVVEKDLVEAIQKGMVGYAALDVFETEPLPGSSPLWKMKNVIVSPHCAGLSDRETERAYTMLRDNLRRYSVGENLINLIDFKAGY